MKQNKDIVQIKNPRSGHYIKIDRLAGRILGRRNSPYAKIPEINGGHFVL